MDMTQTGAPAQAPGQGADPDAQQDATEHSGFTVCIHCDGQGKLSVGVERPDDEQAEAGGEAGGDDEASEVANYTPAANNKEALTLALDLLKSGGKASPPDALGKRLSSAGFSAGYNED